MAQVRAGRELLTLDMCRQLLSDDALQESFAPETELMRHVAGEWQLKRRLLFPGYLFFVTSDVEALHDGLAKVPALTKLLGANGEEKSFSPLTEQEKDWLSAFMDNTHVVRMSEGYIAGDKVKVTRGPLMGMEGDIRKIDRHKRRAYLDITLFGRTVPTSVGLEIIRKTA